MYFVYILKSQKIDRNYIGQTKNITKRIYLHNSGQVKSTKGYAPWKIVCIIEKTTRSEAMILEKKLKNLNRLRIDEFIKKYSH